MFRRKRETLFALQFPSALGTVRILVIHSKWVKKSSVRITSQQTAACLKYIELLELLSEMRLAAAELPGDWMHWEGAGGFMLGLFLNNLLFLSLQKFKLSDFIII